MTSSLYHMVSAKIIQRGTAEKLCSFSLVKWFVWDVFGVFFQPLSFSTPSLITVNKLLWTAGHPE